MNMTMNMSSHGEYHPSSQTPNNFNGRDNVSVHGTADPTGRQVGEISGITNMSQISNFGRHTGAGSASMSLSVTNSSVAGGETMDNGQNAMQTSNTSVYQAILF